MTAAQPSVKRRCQHWRKGEQIARNVVAWHRQCKRNAPPGEDSTPKSTRLSA